MKVFSIIIMSLTLGLTACTTFHPTPPTLVSLDGSTLKKTYYHAEVVTTDDSLIRMTVYQPALKKGEKVIQLENPSLKFHCHRELLAG